MTLRVGTKLGRYEIRSQIGEGGMGEVYRARDEKLNRDVAIKVLPVAYSQDAERLKRFEQEAQAAGSLNHPNILAVYDVGEHEDAPYVVSELLEGETLREKLNGDSLSQRKALDYASQIARGLATAHARGIVHRDLKPENVFVTEDGRVKILDFGLAKLIEPATAVSQTEVPTRKVNTDPGTVMGSVGYMSPEQVRGRGVDHRTDIFSFGAVLYEMLSGQRAFRGDSPADTVSAVLKEDPPDLSVTNKNVSPALERVVRRCLEKNAAERFQSASDLAFDLENISGVSSLGTTTSISDVTAAKNRSWRAIAVAAALVVVIAAVFAGGYFLGGRRITTSELQYHQLTFRRGFISKAAFAPDGQTILYSAAWNGRQPEIFQVRAGSTESQPLGVTNADVCSISATGEVAVLVKRQFLSTSVSLGTLARMPLNGGAPREILESVQSADWSPDGSKLAVVHLVNGANRLEYPIGKVLFETKGFITYPRVSPDGKYIAFMEHDVKYDDRGWVSVVDLNGQTKRLTEELVDADGLIWSGTDQIRFVAQLTGVSGSALYRLNLSGEKHLVAEWPGYFLLLDGSKEGRLLLVRDDVRTDVTGVKPGDKSERDLSWLDYTAARDISPDGSAFIFTSFAEGSSLNYNTYLRKTDGSPAINLGEGDGWAISPDGKWVLALYYSPPHLGILPTGAGEARSLDIVGIESFGRWARWLPDGKRIVFSGRESGKGTRTYLYDLSGGPPRAVTPEGTSVRAVSPDGQTFLAADANGQILEYRFDGGDPSPVAGIGYDDFIVRWEAASRTVFTHQRGEVPIKIYKVNLATGKRDLFKEINPADLAGISYDGFFMSNDGNTYIYYLLRDLCTLYWAEAKD
ncbi:MAG TPA: protein kinase [Pyrinomonadaceae bacterium]